MNNTFFPDNGSISARLHAFTESIRIKQTFDEVINIDSKLKTIFSNQDVNRETNVISKLMVMSLITGKYRVGFAQATVNLKPIEAAVSDVEYQEREFDTLKQVCEILLDTSPTFPWFEKAARTIESELTYTDIINGIKYVILGDCIGSDREISLYHLFGGKWMVYNKLTGEYVVEESYEFDLRSVDQILVTAGMKPPVAVFTFE